MKTDALDITVDHRLATPLYAQISEQVRQMIEREELLPGTVLPTTHQLRASLQINYRTAHRAMATLAREGYVTRQARRGTVVKGIPVRNVVAIFTWMELLEPHTHFEHYRLIVQHLCRHLEKRNRVFRIYLGSRNGDTKSTACDDLLRHVASGAIAGIFVLNAFPKMDQLVQEARATRAALISLTGGVPHDYLIGVDLPGYVRAAARFLRSQGRQRVGIVYNSSSSSFPNRDFVGQLLREAGCPPEDSWIAGCVETEQDGYEAARGLPLNELDGLIVEDDIIALGVDRALREAGIDVPGGLLVTTFWNRGSQLRLSLPFERFEHDVEEQARRAVEMQDDMSRGRRIAEPHVRMCPVHYDVSGVVSSREPACAALTAVAAG